MKRYCLYVLEFALLLLMQACYKDLGNYDYDRIPEIKIDSVKTLKSGGYGTKILFEDSLIIHPVITFGKESASAFTCKWYKRKASTLELIVESPDLELPMNTSGYNEFVLEVIHKRLGVSKRLTTTCLVISKMERGWYVLKETAGGDTEMDGWFEERSEADTVFSVMPDLIQAKFGAPLSGKPVNLEYFNHFWADLVNDTVIERKVLRPVSERDMVALGTTDFECLARFDDFFMEPFPEEDRKIEAAFSYRDMSCLIYNGGKMRTYPNAKITAYMLPYSGRFQMTPRVVMPKSNRKELNRVLGYDESTSSFVEFAGGVTDLTIPEPAISGGACPSKNLNARLLFMGQKDGQIGSFDRSKSGIFYALLQKKSHSDSLLFLHMSAGQLANNMTSSLLVVKIDTLLANKTITGSEPYGTLIQAEYYTMHQYSFILYYTVGSQLYSYNINSKKSGKIDLPELNGKEISWLKYLKIGYDGSYDREKLMVATHQNGEYEILFYDVNASGKPSSPQTLGKGQGKVKTLVYAAPGTDMTNYYVYF